MYFFEKSSYKLALSNSIHDLSCGIDEYVKYYKLTNCQPNFEILLQNVSRLISLKTEMLLLNHTQ